MIMIVPVLLCQLIYLAGESSRLSGTGLAKEWMKEA